MKHSRVTAIVLAMSMGAMLLTSTWANEGKIIVDDPGVAGQEIIITITYAAPAAQDTIKFTPAAADVATPAKKAALIASKIKDQAANSTSTNTVGSNTATVTSKAGSTIAKIHIDAGKSKEKDRKNPSNLRALGLQDLQFEVTLVGAPTGSFQGTLDIGGPGGGVFTLNTNGLSGSSILASFESSIDPLFPSFVTGNSLIITQVTPDNDFLAFFDDPGFHATYSMAAVPEPSSLLFIVLGGSALLVWRNRRSRRQ